MSTFVVVAIRSAAARDDSARADRVRALDELARARGGRLVASGAAVAAFAFAASAAAQALAFVSSAARARGPLRAGVARGEIEGIFAAAPADDGAPWLAAGIALRAAYAFAQRARTNEVKCAADLAAQLGTTIAPLSPGFRASARVRLDEHASRGVRLDARAPFRAERDAALAKLVASPFVGDARSRIAPRPGSVVVLRAPHGTGGTRLLAELASSSERVLVLTPQGQGIAPLGALRHAVVRAGLGRAGSAGRAGGPPAAGAVGALESHVAALRGGRFIDALSASRVVRLAVAYGGEPRALGLVVVDDVERIDAASLEAVARAVEDAPSEIGLVVRLAADEALPRAFGALPVVAEVPLGELRPPEAATLVSAHLRGEASTELVTALVSAAPRTPLGAVLAVSSAVATGDLAVGRDGRFDLRTKTTTRRWPRTLEGFARRLLGALPSDDRRLVSALAVLGGEAPYDVVVRTLGSAPSVVAAAVARLVPAAVLAERHDGQVAIASSSLLRVAQSSIADEELAELRRAAARALRATELGPIVTVEALGHEAAAGSNGTAASEMLDAARAADRAGLPQPAVQLAERAVAFDPSLEERASVLLARAGVAAKPAVRTASQKLEAIRVHPSPALGMRGTSQASARSMPPSERRVPAVPGSTPPAVAPPARSSNRAPVASPAPPDVARLPELTRSAVRGGDALERWLDGPGRALENPRLEERLRAMASIGRGEAPEAVRTLRRARADVAETDLAGRCRASLALGVALAAAGRTEEALLEGLDALARAREGQDDAGGRACLAFLAKIYASVGRLDDARRLSPT